MKKITVEIEGRKVEGYASFSRGVLWAHVDGQTFTLEEPRKAGRRSRGAGGGASAGEVQAPMPGKIIKVQVRAGDHVDAHQVLLVMEAMKMEYTLKAPAAGTVREISCQAGDQVALGQTLVKLEPQ